MSNEMKMTLNERVAQRIKESPLGMLFDEDDLTEVTKQAIQTAFFSPEVRRDGYRDVHSDPVLVVMARDVFRTAMEARMKEIATEMTKDPAFNELIVQGIMAQLPSVMAGFTQNIIQQSTMAVQSSQWTQVEAQVRNHLMNMGK